MNWLLIVVILVIAANIVWGYRKGFLRVLYSLVVMCAILFLVSYATGYVTDYLIDHTGIDEKICAAYEDTIRTSIEGGLDAAEDNAEQQVEEGLSTDTSLDRIGIHIPSFVNDKLADSNEVAKNTLENEGVYYNLASQLTYLTMKAIAFLLCLVVAFVLYILIAKLLDLVAKLPVIHTLNKTLGLLTGALRGLAFVWIFFAIMAFCSASTVGGIINELVQESLVLTWIYDCNPVLGIIMLFF